MPATGAPLPRLLLLELGHDDVVHSVRVFCPRIDQPLVIARSRGLNGLGTQFFLNCLSYFCLEQSWHLNSGLLSFILS